MTRPAELAPHTTGPGSDGPEAAPPAPVLLRGWKEIAGHLHVSSRSAQRWANELGLPVHRTGRSRGSVAAYVHELDAWQRRQAGMQPTPADGDVRDADGEVPGDETPSGARGGLDAGAGAAGRRRARGPYILTAIAGVVLLALVAAWSFDSWPRPFTAGTSTAGAARARVTAAGSTSGAAALPPGIALAVRSPQSSISRLVVPDGGMGRVGITGGAEVGLEVSLRDGKLHLTVYDFERPAGTDGSFVPSGFFVIDRPDPEALKRTRFEFAEGWLEVAWVGIQ